MTALALCSVKASPGVTTTTQALAEVWPTEREVLIAELDPAGGDLAARLQRPPEPGLVSLAAAGRRGLDLDLLLDHAQPSSDSTRILLAPPSGRQAAAALDLLGDALADALLSLDGVDVLMDCGRLDPGSVPRPWLTAADQMLCVLRPTAAEVAQVAATLPDVRAEVDHIALIVIGEPGPGRSHLYPADEVAAAVGAEVVGVIADDDRAAGVFDGRRRGERTFRKSQLLRSASALSAVLTGTVAATRADRAPRNDAATSATPPLLVEGAS